MTEDFEPSVAPPSDDFEPSIEPNVKKKVSTESESGLPKYVAAQTSESTSESAGGASESFKIGNDTNPEFKDKETAQEKSTRLNSSLTPSAKAQKNFLVSQAKHEELLANPNSNPLDIDKSVKQIQT